MFLQVCQNNPWLLTPLEETVKELENNMSVLEEWTLRWTCLHHNVIQIKLRNLLLTQVKEEITLKMLQNVKSIQRKRSVEKEILIHQTLTKVIVKSQMRILLFLKLNLQLKLLQRKQQNGKDSNLKLKLPKRINLISKRK